MTLPPVDYDKLASYPWKVWTEEGGWWVEVEEDGEIDGPFATEKAAHQCALSGLHE